MIFYQNVCTIALFRVTIIYQRIVKSIYVARCFPRCGMHENGSIDTYDILMEQGHRIPPITLDIVFQFYAILAVVIHCAKAVVNF